MPTEKKVNYTPEMESTLLAATPFDFETAKVLASKMRKNPRSIVAKIKRMENDESVKGERPFYKSQPEYVSKTGNAVEKKSDIVAEIAILVGAVSDSLKGLEKAPKSALVALRDSVTVGADSSDS